MRTSRHFRHLPLVLAVQTALPLLAHAQTNLTAPNTNLGAGTYQVSAGTTLNATDASVLAFTAGTATLNNYGTISTGSNTSGTTAGGPKTIDVNTNNVRLVLNNYGTISSVRGVGVRLNKASNTFAIDNQGTIQVTGDVADSKSVAINTSAVTTTGNIIRNGSETNRNALITSSSMTAIKLGGGTELTNLGTISSTSPVNTKCADYITACGVAVGGVKPSDVKAADGIAVEKSTIGTVILNHGNIIGARHGISGDISATPAATGTALLNAIVDPSTFAANVVTTNGLVTGVNNLGNANATVINYADGVITGNNGSGVGFDGHGVVFNYGTISGNYAGAGNIYNKFGSGIDTSLNGDGDGVDIDGVAYVENWGTIKGTGAGGFDSGGAPNGADGIAAGGGVIINHAGATIYGQSKGILIDDGSDGATAARRGTADATGANAYIINDGTITGERKVAVGLVGNFADTLINTGTITGGAQATRLGDNNSTAPGAAVQMGDGDDKLTNYGRIEGKNGMAIDMGAGADKLQLFGGIVIGTIDGGAGDDTLETGGTQVFNSGIISNFENFVVKNGSTTFNYGLGTVTSVQVEEGASLRVDGALSTSDALTVKGTFRTTTANDVRTINAGSFLLDGKGVLETGLGVGNTADKIVVTNAAEIKTGATITPIAKAYVNSGSRYTIVTAAGGLTATPANINVADTAMIDYSLSKSGNDLVLNAQRTGTIANVASGVSGNLGQVLDALGNSNNAAAARMLGAIDNLPTQQAVRDAVQQLAPETNNASRQATQTGNNAVFSAFENRIDSARGGMLAGQPSGIAAGDNNRRAWLQGLGSWGEQDPRAGATGYKLGAYGVAGGFETDLAARDVMGVSLGYTNAYSNGTGTATGDDTKVKAVSVGGYFSRTENDWTLDASVVAGFNSYKSERQIAFTGFNETARGDYNGWQVGGRVEVGFPFAMSQTLSGRWLVGARAAYLSTESYTETGDASITQSIGSSHANSFQPTLGVELNQAMSDQGRLQLRARYLRELADNPDIQATFVAGGPSFTSNGVKPNRDAVQVGIGYRWATATGSFITVGYDAEFREKSLVNQVTARASWAF